MADQLERAKQGDREALANLLEPLLDPAYRLALQVLGRQAAAEDAVQDACLNALRAIHRFQGEADRIRPWFLTIVANQCRSQRRRPFFRWGPLWPWHQDRSPSIEDQVLEHLDLRRQLETLKPAQVLVLVLFYYLDLPLTEVAAVLDCSVTAARSRLYRAVDALRERLDEPEDSR